MAEDWKTGYRQALLAAFVRDASPVKTSGDTYYGGWQDYERLEAVRRHLSGCAPTLASTMPTDAEWSEFMGTFYDGDETKHGLDAIITCHCGYVRDVRLRLEGTFSELLEQVLRED